METSSSEIRNEARGAQYSRPIRYQSQLEYSEYPLSYNGQTELFGLTVNLRVRHVVAVLLGM